MLHAAYLLYLDALHRHTGVRGDERLYLTQLYAEAAKLHLAVNTTEVFYLTVLVVTHKVTRMIYRGPVRKGGN